MTAAEVLDWLRASGMMVEAGPGGELHVWPDSLLTPAMRSALAWRRDELLALFDAPPALPPAADKPAPDYGRRCVDCRHLTRRRTCLQPERAGLIAAGAGFGIAWPGPAHAALCPAWLAADAPAAAQGGHGGASGHAPMPTCRPHAENGPKAA